MIERIIRVTCANCNEDIDRRIADFTGENITHADLEIDSEGFDCGHCGETTGITLIKEVL